MKCNPLNANDDKIEIHTEYATHTIRCGQSHYIQQSSIDYHYGLRRYGNTTPFIFTIQKKANFAVMLKIADDNNMCCVIVSFWFSSIPFSLFHSVVSVILSFVSLS